MLVPAPHHVRSLVRVASIALLSTCCALVLSGCGAARLEASQHGSGPELLRSSPAAGGKLGDARRIVSLTFDRPLDTGAQVSVARGRSDVVAATPELSPDRRRLTTRIDVEDSGTYLVNWKACSASDPARCSEGRFGFRAERR